MTKKKMAWACGLALITIASYFLYTAIERIDRADRAQLAQYEQELAQHQQTIGVVETLSKSARTLADWEEVRSRAATLPADAKKHFSLLANIGTMELSADRRDRLLFNAGVLHKVNERDPGVQMNLAQAKDLQEKIDRLLKQIGDMGGMPGAMALQYRAAYEKYRSLAFLQKEEADKARDIIDDAMGNLKRANAIVPKDNRVELFMELLYKRDKEEQAKQSGGPKPGPPRALPTRPGPDQPGNQRSDRPHRH